MIRVLATAQGRAGRRRAGRGAKAQFLHRVSSTKGAPPHTLRAPPRAPGGVTHLERPAVPLPCLLQPLSVQDSLPLPLRLRGPWVRAHTHEQAGGARAGTRMRSRRAYAIAHNAGADSDTGADCAQALTHVQTSRRRRRRRRSALAGACDAAYPARKGDAATCASVGVASSLVKPVSPSPASRIGRPAEKG